MSRTRIPIGGWGTIRRFTDERGIDRAMTRFRNERNDLVKVSRSGPNPAAAERNLRNHLDELAKEIGSSSIGPDTTVGDLAAIFLEELDEDINATRADSTKERYRDLWERVIADHWKNQRVVDVRVRPVEKWLRDIAATHPTKAHHVKAVLSMIMDLAVRYDRISGNPVKSAVVPRIKREPKRALTAHDVKTVLTAIAQYNAASKTRRGPSKAGRDLLHVMILLACTGSRIGEILALRWDNVDLASTPPRIRIAGAVVEIGGRLVLQEHTKTRSTHWIALPSQAVDVLMQRKTEDAANPANLVFATRTGRPIQDGNLLRPWRAMRDELGYGWVTPHTLRRTVATTLADLAGTDAAQQQLGHATRTTTERHYIDRDGAVIDNADLIASVLPPLNDINTSD